jgi:hypothetical protein
MQQSSTPEEASIINPAQFPWKGRCAQCGKASTMQWIRENPPTPGLHATEWCDAHAPDVWQMVERRRKTLEKMRRAAEARRWTRN